MRRKSRPAHVVVGVTFSFLLSLFAAGPAEADNPKGTSYRHRQITINADTKDIHISIAGDIMDKGVKVHNDTTDKDVKFDDQQYNGTNRFSGGTLNPICAKDDKLSLDVCRTGTGTWNMKVWLTTDGDVTTFPTGKPTNVFASLFLDPVSPGHVAIVAFNDSPDQIVSYSGISTWESNDLSTFNLDQFRSIDAGTPLADSIYLPGITSGFSLAPGELKVLTNPLTEDENRYFYVQARDESSSIPGGLIDGFAFQATAVPEPGVLTLAGTAAVLGLAYAMSRRRRSAA